MTGPDQAGRTELLGLIIRGTVSLAALGGATLLAIRGRIESEAVVVLYTTVIALWGAAVTAAIRPTPPSSGS